jgi:hypothetical protein
MVHDVRAEPERGELERDARARARLEEQVGDGVSAQALVACRQIARLTHVELRQIEEIGQLGGAQAFQRDEVP